MVANDNKNPAALFVVVHVDGDDNVSAFGPYDSEGVAVVELCRFVIDHMAPQDGWTNEVTAENNAGHPLGFEHTWEDGASGGRTDIVPLIQGRR